MTIWVYEIKFLRAQFSSTTHLCSTLFFFWPHGLHAAHQASLSISNWWSLLKLMSIESLVPSNHLILCYPLLPPWVSPRIRVFSSESVVCIRWAKCWSFSVSPSNEYSGLISIRIESLILAVQGTLKSLLQHHSSKASILKCTAFFIVQLTKSQNNFSHLWFTVKLLFVIMKLSFTLWFLFGETSFLLVWTSSTFVSSQGLLLVNVKLFGFWLAVYYPGENNICKIERPMDFGPDNVR